MRSPFLSREYLLETAAYNFHLLANHFVERTIPLSEEVAFLCSSLVPRWDLVFPARPEEPISQNVDHLREDEAISRASKRRADEDQAYCERLGIPLESILQEMEGVEAAGERRTKRRADAAAEEKDTEKKEKLRETMQTVGKACQHEEMPV